MVVAAQRKIYQTNCLKWVRKMVVDTRLVSTKLSEIKVGMLRFQRIPWVGSWEKRFKGIERPKAISPQIRMCHLQVPLTRLLSVREVPS